MQVTFLSAYYVLSISSCPLCVWWCWLLLLVLPRPLIDVRVLLGKDRFPKFLMGSRGPQKSGGLPAETRPAGDRVRHQTPRDKHKGQPGLARSQEVGRDGAGPGPGQQPLPGFLTALLFEAGSWTSRKWATSLPTKERKLLECFSSTSRTGPVAGDGSQAKAA